MKNKKQLFFNILFLIIVLIFTMLKLFKGNDIKECFKQILNVNYFYLFLGFLLILIFVLSESVIIKFLLKKIGIKSSFFDCTLYSFIGFLFSNITPSASGGQPAQMLYMKKGGISVGKSTPLLMIVTIAYKGVLVLIGAFIMIFNFSDIKHYISGIGIYIYFGLFANIILLIFIILLLIYPHLLYVFCKKIYNSFIGSLLGEKRFFLREKAKNYLDRYVETAIYYKGHYNNMALPVFIITFIQRCSFFAVTVVVYKSMNLSGTSLFAIFILSATINVAVDMLPLPGGMGATEILFISLYSEIFGNNKVVTALLINRFITFYLLIILGVLSLIVASIRFNRKKKNARIL